MQSIVQQCSVVSVCLSVGHGRKLCQTGWTNHSGVYGVDSCRNCALGGGLDLPGEGAVLGTFFWPIVPEVTFLYFRH